MAVPDLAHALACAFRAWLFPSGLGFLVSPDFLVGAGFRVGPGFRVV